MRLFVPLTRDEIERLKELAREQRRRPQDQAAVLLAQSLSNRSSLPTTPVAQPAAQHNAVPAGARP